MNFGIDQQAVLRRALRNGGEYADLFLENSNPLLIQCEEDRIERVLAGTERGAGLRLISGGRTAYAYTNEITTAALFELADAVSTAMAGMSREASPMTRLLQVTSRGAPNARVLPAAVGMETKVALVTRANRTARSLDHRIRQVQVSYRENRQQVQIITSEGRLVEDDRQYLTAAVHVVAADDGIVQTGYEPVGGSCGMELFETAPLEQAAERAAKRAVMMLGARKAPAGRMPVVLSSEAGGTMIHEAVGHGLEADLAQTGLSVYSGKIGQQIASPLVTVLDDATLANRRGTFSVDDEGTEAQCTVLVERGVLKTYLYDSLTARKDGVRSTGNGRRESFRHRPIPRMTNTLIAPGASAPDAVLRSTPSGLFVRRMGGGQVNTVTGEFVFEVSEGYLIENGSLGEPVRGATLIGSGPDVLRSIDAVGSDLGFSIGTCGKDGQGSPVSDAQPTLRIPEITVGGEVA